MTSNEVEHTEDGRYIVVRGRRWRATDPSIPDTLRTELVSALMTGRRLVKTEGDAARVMVHDAKVALGERGDPWWEPTEEGTRQRLAATIRTLLRSRGDGSICPSDAARTVGGERWRELMETARGVAVDLSVDGVVVIVQRGEIVSGTDVRGPVRIVAAEALDFRPPTDGRTAPD
ncbi:DUF3253 domain-containing protein [Dietzia psychralcaliphila]|uniref:DUF3253 domain-containing protein n=1 Tax=Dietzia psychralcaliphila TaxID=139021 RepID=A0AAD0JT81_9ACTN|nr:DUF3253 domain-containing protein [Dietzia psychralcaliphila]AWH95138.1 hypothetical protein A6048_06190 [Dietzia psychralcaliphila]PTM87366.1 uncharacterized protein DUF3253 [Dietzia psychralcaliphila]